MKELYPNFPQIITKLILIWTNYATYPQRMFTDPDGEVFMAFDLSALYTFSFQQSRIGTVINTCEIFHEV